MSQVQAPQSPRVKIAPRAQNATGKIEKNRPNMIITDVEEGNNEFPVENQQSKYEMIANDVINTLNLDEVTVQNAKSIRAIIHKKRAEAMTIGMMEEAKQCDAAYRAIMSKVGTIKQESTLAIRIAELQQQLNDATNLYETLKIRWANVIANAEKNKIKELKELDEQNEKELAELDATFDGDPPSTFKKLSPKVVELKHTILVTGKSGNLKEANRLKQQLEEMIEEERAQNREEWRAVFHVARDELERNLIQKYNLRVEQLDRDIIKMKRFKENELLRAKRSVEHLQSKLAKYSEDDQGLVPELPRAPQTARTPRRNSLFNKSTSIFIPRRGSLSKPSTPRSPNARRTFRTH